MLQRKYFAVGAPKPNPFIGFTSFQHFEGDPIYSDIVVNPANHALETETRECYPVPPETEQNGFAEGFYPSSTVAYIRILWKEFEPERGVFRYELVSDILNKAEKAGQTVMFRLLPHSTRPCDDVPEWLKALTPCPERPAGKRVKDSPADPIYLRYFGEAITALGGRFDANPVLEMMDISITGAWGEGSGIDNYPREALFELMDVYASAFPKTQLIAQGSASWLIDYLRAKGVAVGWRGDGVGDPFHLFDIYARNAAKLPEQWQSGPVSFESYWWLGEWMREGWSLDDVIEHTLRWHISHFNGKSMPIPEAWREKVDYWLSKMGYHFVPRMIYYPESVAAGETLRFELNMENRGVAPIYHRLPLHFRLTNGKTALELPCDFDIRRWMPGDHLAAFALALPKSLEPGNYALEMAVFDDRYSVAFETDAPANGRYTVLTELTVTE